MGVSLLLCLLPALLATASAQAGTLTCNVCIGPTAACDLFEDTCQDDPATGGCLSVAEETSLDGRKDTFFRKQCLSSYKNPIKSPISFTVGADQYVRLNVTQCNNTDECNSATLQVNNTLNGLQCPTCFALNFAACNSEITPCTGQETYCIDFTGNWFQGDSPTPFEAQGCASASAQEIKPRSNLTVAIYKFAFYWVTAVKAQPIPSNPSTAPTTPPPTTNTIPPPANDTSPAANATSPAANTTLPPENTTSPAANTTSPAANATLPPANATLPPANATLPPANTTSPAANATLPPANATLPPANTASPAANTTQKTTPPPRTSTTNGGSLALGTVPFALYLPGLMGLLLVKLLS